MDFAAYRRLDATALAAEVAAGRVSATALLDLALARLAQVQPALNPVCALMEGRARAQIDAGLHGPLAGVPFLIKDAGQDYAGKVSGQGSKALSALPAAGEHSHTVRRFLQAGLVVFGKTNTPELALKGVTDPRHTGLTRNPWDLGRTPGGSSGGAAAAVAAGVLPMAGANDGGGSIRIPAACCGLVGLKPSRGRISEGPQRGSIWFGASSQGVVSRSLRDSALALDVLAGPEPGDPFTLPVPALPFVQQMQQPLRRLRVAWSAESPIGTPVHDEARAAVEHTVALLSRLGHHCMPAQPAVDGAQLARDYLQIYFGAVPAAVDQARAAGVAECDFEPLTRLMACIGRSTPAGVFAAALERWHVYGRQLAELWRDADVYLTPTLAEPPVRHGAGDPPAWQLSLLAGLRETGLLGWLARRGLLDRTVDDMARDSLRAVPFTQLANLTGVPAISLPLHWTADGLPLGLQFTAAMGDEGLLLQLGLELERAQPWLERLPPDGAAAPNASSGVCARPDSWA